MSYEKKFIFGLLLLFFLVVSSLLAKAVLSNSSNYQIYSEIVSSGGVNTSSDNYATNSLLGTVSGVTNSSLYNLYTGFWYTLSETATSYPVITFADPTPAGGIRQTRNWIFVNVTVNDNFYNISACILEWQNGTSGQTLNYTMNIIGTGKSIICWQNVTTTDEINYTYKVYANNSQHYLANSSWRNNTENSLPSAVDLVYPATGASTTNRTPQFNWTVSTDAESDPLTYEVNISCFPSCSSDNRMINSSSNQNWTTLTSRLKYFWDDLYYYNWTVRAWDGYEFGEWNITPMTIKLSSLVSISMLNASVNFSALGMGATQNTSTNDPFPLSIKNLGNCFVSINMSNETSLLWSSQQAASNYYRYKIDNLTGQEGSFDWSQSITAWTDVPTSNNTVINYLNYTDTMNSAEIDVLVTVPPQEPAGLKSSRLVFTGFYVREI